MAVNLSSYVPFFLILPLGAFPLDHHMATPRILQMWWGDNIGRSRYVDGEVWCDTG